MAIAVKLDDILHDRRMTLTELADRARGTNKSIKENIK
jgi:DNA-binding Xre family transcriptional regulator